MCVVITRHAVSCRKPKMCAVSPKLAWSLGSTASHQADRPNPVSDRPNPLDPKVLIWSGGGGMSHAGGRVLLLDRNGRRKHLTNPDQVHLETEDSGTTETPWEPSQNSFRPSFLRLQNSPVGAPRPAPLPWNCFILGDLRKRESSPPSSARWPASSPRLWLVLLGPLRADGRPCWPGEHSDVSRDHPYHSL